MARNLIAAMEAYRAQGAEDRLALELAYGIGVDAAYRQILRERDARPVLNYAARELTQTVRRPSKQLNLNLAD